MRASDLSPVAIEAAMRIHDLYNDVMSVVLSEQLKVIIEPNTFAYADAIKGLPLTHVTSYSVEDNAFIGLSRASAQIALARKVISHAKGLIVIPDPYYEAINGIAELKVKTAYKQLKPVWIAGDRVPINVIRFGIWVTEELNGVPGHTYLSDGGVWS